MPHTTLPQWDHKLPWNYHSTPVAVPDVLKPLWLVNCLQLAAALAENLMH